MLCVLCTSCLAEKHLSSIIIHSLCVPLLGLVVLSRVGGGVRMAPEAYLPRGFSVSVVVDVCSIVQSWAWNGLCCCLRSRYNVVGLCCAVGHAQGGGSPPVLPR